MIGNSNPKNIERRMIVEKIIDILFFALYCCVGYSRYYKLVYCKGQTNENPYTKSDMLKSLIIGNLLSTLISIAISKVCKVYLLGIYSQFAIGGSIILFGLVSIIYDKYNDEAESLIINKNTMVGYITASVTFVFVDLRSSMLFLCALSLQYIYVNTNWPLTRNFTNLLLLLTLLSSLMTILFGDLIRIGYTRVKMTDYWLDILSYYVVCTYTLVHWIVYYIFSIKKEDQSLPESLDIELKE